MSKKPEIIVFAGPNGSGKSSITIQARILQPYINADDIKREKGCTDLEAAEEADRLRFAAIDEKRDFSFETVLSTHRKIEMLERAKKRGYFIRCVYVLTDDPQVNIMRVAVRVESGGHNVEKRKIVQRYHRCMELVPEVFWLSNVFYLYDNTERPERIAMKKRDQLFLYGNDFWSEDRILNLLNLIVKK
ncbi:zeta toxin family protein [Bacilliculturomica massiliensis]|uniref:zeta toxin family protein n=1 Tax=Bacilliculturomica massiliensis TaxID=1917867 RepID=UPI00102F58A7|nr:zeta toxin family protein [Bacilliculturomica massiliensis]